MRRKDSENKVCTLSLPSLDGNICNCTLGAGYSFCIYIFDGKFYIGKFNKCRKVFYGIFKFCDFRDNFNCNMFDFRLSYGLFYLRNSHKTSKCNNNAAYDSNVDEFLIENLCLDDYIGV